MLTASLSLKETPVTQFTDWYAAADKFLKHRQAQQTTTPGTSEYEAAFAAELARLDQFLIGSCCHAGLALLKASGRHIVLIDHEGGGPSGTIYFLDGDGLKQSTEATGMWVAYAKPSSVKPPQVTVATAREVLEAGRHRQISVDVLIATIVSKLNEIARSAPKD